MRISIIVPVLNEVACIGAALAALDPLRRRGHEVIVVDGGSGDGTPERARGGADKVLAAPRGRASQMNEAARAASGEVLLFLHADTLLPAGASGVSPPPCCSPHHIRTPPAPTSAGAVDPGDPAR